MAVGSDTWTWVAAVGYRGKHTGHGRRRHGAGSHAQVTLIASAGVGLALVATAAVLPLPSKGLSHLLSSLPTRTTSPPPQDSIPRTQPSGPSSPSVTLFTARSPSPAQSTTAPRPTSSRTVSTPPRASATARPSVHPPAVPIGYEAEAASNVLGGAAHIRAMAEASSGQVVTSLGGSPANTLQFNLIIVPFDGVYTLVIRYVSPGDRTANISVDGGRSVSLQFPSTNDLGTEGLLALRLRLASGANSITFSNPFTKAPDIDQIIVGS